MQSFDAVTRKPSQEKPWLKFFSEEAKKAVLPEKTIYTYLKEQNIGHESNIALNYFGRQISYGKLLKKIDRAAGAFARLGVKKGDIVCCCTVTIPEMVYALYGLNKLGASPIVLDPRTSPAGIKKFIDETGSKLLFVLDLYFDAMKELIDELDMEKVVVISADTSLPVFLKLAKSIKMPAPHIDYTDKIISWKEFEAYGECVETEAVEYGENPLTAITLTGGTTGFPKGVMISNDGFNAISIDFGNCGVSYTRNQRFLNIIPMFSSYGIVSSLHMPLTLGLEVVIIPKFDQEKVGHYIKKYKPAHTLLVPAHYEKLMNSKEMANGFDLSFFETAGSGGDTMNAGLEAKLNGFLKERGCKYPLSQGYGMSEASSAASCCCAGNFKSLSVGYPLLTTTISVFKPDSVEELGYNEEGEICISGPSVMLGYLNNKCETDKTIKIHPDGSRWIHSGDIGYIDEDGFVFIKGRIKRMITLFNGHKIFPTHIESVIGTHDLVQSCAVIGVKDRTHAQGKLTVAIVELNEGVEDDFDALKAEIKELCIKELEGPAVPYEIRFTNNMPHTGMGKIDYLKLENDYETEIDSLSAV